DYLSSKRIYDKILLIEPNNTDAQEGLEKLKQELAKIKQERINQQQAKVINKFWKDGVILYKKGDFVRAKDKFNEILKIDPNHEPTKKYLTDIDTQISQLNAQQINDLYLRAVALFKDKKYLEASKYFEAVTISAPHRLDAQEYLQKCKQAIQEEEERKKQEELARLQEKHKKEMEEIFNDALKLYEKQDYIKALDVFTKSKEMAERCQFSEYLEKSNNYIETIKMELSEQYYKKGYQLYQQNRIEEAYTEYSKALEYAPNNVTVEGELNRLREQLAQKYYEIGISYYTKGELEKAKEYFRKSLNYMPNKEETLRALERIK
ncbi:MAG: tetratricopeptide repeat protein, partial [Endomicrobiia bacterium]